MILNQHRYKPALIGNGVLKSWFVRMNPITASKCGGGPFLYKQKAIIGDYLDQNQLTTGTHDWAIYYLLISSTNQHQY